MTNVKEIKVRSEHLPDYISENLPSGIELVGVAHPDVGTVLRSQDKRYSVTDIDDLSAFAYSCEISDQNYVSNAEIASRIATEFGASSEGYEQVYHQALAYLMRSRVPAQELSATDPTSTYKHYLDLWGERYANETQNLASLINRLASAQSRSGQQRQQNSEKRIGVAR